MLGSPTALVFSLSEVPGTRAETEGTVRLWGRFACLVSGEARPDPVVNYCLIRSLLM